MNGYWRRQDAATWVYEQMDAQGQRHPCGYALCRRIDGAGGALWDAVLTDTWATVRAGVPLEVAQLAVEEAAAISLAQQGVEPT